MAKQTINIGTAPNDGTGTPLRTAFDYCNLNFTELYTAVGPSGNNIVVPGTATITGDLTVDTNVLKVDTSNNRVGILTASPAYPLQVAGRISYSTGIGEGADLTVSSSGATLQFGLGSSWTQQLFYLAGSEAMRLNSTGLGLGTSPSQRLTVSGNISLINTAATSIGMTNATSGITYTLFSASPAGNGFTGFGIYDGSAYIMRTNQQGDFGVGVLPDNAKSACLQLKSGVSFPSAQVASADANTLDDYEEGTWVGTLKGSVSDPTVAVTATGKYTKIGRKVFVEITFNAVNTTGASGHITVTGLPFPCGTPINGVGGISLNTIGTYTGDPYVFLNQGTSILELYANVSNGAGNTITHNAGAARFMTTSVTYTV